MNTVLNVCKGAVENFSSGQIQETAAYNTHNLSLHHWAKDRFHHYPFSTFLQAKIEVYIPICSFRVWLVYRTQFFLKNFRHV